jgi:hypothetical protein
MELVKERIVEDLVLEVMAAIQDKTWISEEMENVG